MAVRSVIIVPGLLASKINRPALVGWLATIWLSPPNLLAGFFDWLALPLPDQPGLPPSYAITLPGTPIGALYGPLSAYLTLRGWPVLTTRADWRRPLSYDGELLLAQVRTQGLIGPVGLVCHSRGGLLARYVANRLAALGELNKLECVVTLGTPHVGSMNAVLFLSGQGSLLDRLANLGTNIRGVRVQTLAFSRIREVLRSWPSVYELLPDPDRSTLPAPERAAVYQSATYTGQPSVPYQPHLDSAVQTWRALPDFPAGVRVLRVGGEFVDTIQGFSAPPAPGYLPPFTWSGDGDGTVPTTSSFWPGDQGVLVPCAHDALPLDGRVWPYIHACLGGETGINVTLGGDVFNPGG